MNISFEFLHPIYGVYKDTLCLPDDHEFTDNELEEMKQQRYDNWTNYIETSSAKQSIEEVPVEE